jgi:hypothetical protein
VTFYPAGTTLIVKDGTQILGQTDAAFNVFIHAGPGDIMQVRTETGAIIQVPDGAYTVRTTSGAVTLMVLNNQAGQTIWSIISETQGNPRLLV